MKSGTRLLYRILRGLSILCSSIVAFSCATNENQTNDIINTFSIADGFRIELVAMEPLVSDPVAMEIDENGQVYVVEMHGYPLDVAGSGVVRKLYDDDQDGLFDRSEVFYDQLILPTGIMRWKQGVLVADPPDLLYLEDTDGDGTADKREVLLTGFALSNPQHNFNSPVYGLDNWIYLANEGTYESEFFGDIFGDEGDEIRFPGHPDAPRLPRNANDLNVRVNPNDHLLELLSGDSQYGHTFDKWGHHFGTKNWAHIYHEVLAASIIERNRDLEVPSAMQYVPDYGIGFDLYPVTQNPEHQLLTDVGAITSACGITWYLGGSFPEPFNEVVFVAEPTHNLVHTDIMYDKGATFGSKQQYQGREFLASTDAWFRPVNFYTGPDGSLYLLDFHRKIIEHPEWISEEVLNSGELYAGVDQGRIYRISLADKAAKDSNSNSVSVGSASPEELIQYLEHPNIWWRRNAQRLLVDQQDPDMIPHLKKFIGSASEMGVLHGLWTLEGLGHFDPQLVMLVLDHSSAGVRENALKIATIHREGFQRLEDKLVAMADDPDGKVRFQLLCTLGYYHSQKSADARNQLIFNDLEDPWMQLAGLSASSLDALQLFVEAVSETADKPSEAAKSLFMNLSRSIGKSGDANQLNRVIGLIGENTGEKNIWWQSVTLAGLSETTSQELWKGVSNKNRVTLEGYFADKVDPALRSGSVKLLHALGYFDRVNTMVPKARQVVPDPDRSPEFRADAIKLLAWADADGNSSQFQKLLISEENSLVRSAAIDALGLTHGPEECDFLIDHWKSLVPAEREQAVNVFRTSDERKIQLLRAVESNNIQAAVLGWRRTVELLNSRNDHVRELARTVLEGNETISDSLWLQYQQALTLEGDRLKGQQTFANACSSCHQLGGQNGTNYGPDLSAVRNRSKSGILIDILKPNRSISDGYDLWSIEDRSGQVHSGIILAENSNTLTLRNAAGAEIRVQQDEITGKTAAEISAMPEGLHNQIAPEQMADLLEFLKNGGTID